MRPWVQCNVLKFIGNESRKNILEGLRTVLEYIHSLCL
jgi:hypothetical protein